MTCSSARHRTGDSGRLVSINCYIGGRDRCHRCWTAHEGDRLEVEGSIQQLGKGDRALELNETDTPNWAAQASTRQCSSLSHVDG